MRPTLLGLLIGLIGCASIKPTPTTPDIPLSDHVAQDSVYPYQAFDVFIPNFVDLRQNQALECMWISELREKNKTQFSDPDGVVRNKILCVPPMSNPGTARDTPAGPPGDHHLNYWRPPQSF